MFCVNCGKQIDEESCGSRFCAYCGAPLTKTDAAGEHPEKEDPPVPASDAEATKESETGTLTGGVRAPAERTPDPVGTAPAGVPPMPPGTPENRTLQRENGADDKDKKAVVIVLVLIAAALLLVCILLAIRVFGRKNGNPPGATDTVSAQTGGEQEETAGTDAKPAAQEAAAPAATAGSYEAPAPAAAEPEKTTVDAAALWNRLDGYWGNPNRKNRFRLFKTENGSQMVVTGFYASDLFHVGNPNGEITKNADGTYTVPVYYPAVSGEFGYDAFSATDIFDLSEIADGSLTIITNGESERFDYIGKTEGDINIYKEKYWDPLPFSENY